MFAHHTVSTAKKMQKSWHSLEFVSVERLYQIQAEMHHHNAVMIYDV